MARLSQSLLGRCQQRGTVPTPVLAIKDEEGPDVTGLMVGAEKTLHRIQLFRDQKNRMLLIPIDLRLLNLSRIKKPILGGSVPDSPYPLPIR